MKTMTCRQLGGPCDTEHRGENANDVIKAQDQHLKEMVANGDEAHRPANDEMRGRWKHPVAGLGWYRQAKKDFAALPDGAQAKRAGRPPLLEAYHPPRCPTASTSPRTTPPTR